MIRAVLFDLDDTLLSINLTPFVFRYTASTCKLVADFARMPVHRVLDAMARAQLAASSQRRTDSLTNAQFFNREFFSLTGIPLDDPVIADAVACHELEVVPRLGGGIVDAHPRPGGRACYNVAKGLGLTVALATNPSFTKNVLAARMGWAGFGFDDFAYVSHMGNSHRVKPSSRYYAEFCYALGLYPEECLMVGNDARRDLATPDIGLATAYVGLRRPERAVWRGDMVGLSKELPALIDHLNAERF